MHPSSFGDERCNIFWRYFTMCEKCTDGINEMPKTYDPSVVRTGSTQIGRQRVISTLSQTPISPLTA